MRRRLGRSTMMNGASSRRKVSKRCQTRLDEYWEVEGKMLCERHMKIITGVQRMRAERRVTRFIDLTDFR